MHFSKTDIEQLDKIARLNLINSITGIKPANLIASVNEKGHENLAIFSSVVHLGSNPAIIGFVTRPVDIVPRDTYDNIISTGHYTINHVPLGLVENAHYTSAKFSRDVSEFDTCRFTSEYLADFPAPFVRQSNCKIGLKFLESIPITINDTALIVGSVEHVHINDHALSEDFQIDLDKLHSVGISGLNRYYDLGLKQEFPYARVEELPNFTND